MSVIIRCCTRNDACKYYFTVTTKKALRGNAHTARIPILQFDLGPYLFSYIQWTKTFCSHWQQKGITLPYANKWGVLPNVQSQAEMSFILSLLHYNGWWIPGKSLDTCCVTVCIVDGQQHFTFTDMVANWHELMDDSTVHYIVHPSVAPPQCTDHLYINVN